MTYILDACALIAFFDKEAEGIKVKELIDKAVTDPIVIYMSIVNLVEVYYGYINKKGVVEADKQMAEIKDYPIKTIDTISNAVYRTAAYYKGTYEISLADSFAAATAKSLSAIVVTKDGEFQELEKNENLSVMWIKEPPPKF
jgi:predicted nucleic acid-binding protein